MNYTPVSFVMPPASHPKRTKINANPKKIDEDDVGPQYTSWLTIIPTEILREICLFSQMEDLICLAFTCTYMERIPVYRFIRDLEFTFSSNSLSYHCSAMIIRKIINAKQMESPGSTYLIKFPSCEYLTLEHTSTDIETVKDVYEMEKAVDIFPIQYHDVLHLIMEHCSEISPDLLHILSSMDVADVSKLDFTNVESIYYINRNDHLYCDFMRHVVNHLPRLKKIHSDYLSGCAATIFLELFKRDGLSININRHTIINKNGMDELTRKHHYLFVYIFCNTKGEIYDLSSFSIDRIRLDYIYSGVYITTPKTLKILEIHQSGCCKILNYKGQKFFSSDLVLDELFIESFHTTPLEFFEDAPPNDGVLGYIKKVTICDFLMVDRKKLYDLLRSVHVECLTIVFQREHTSKEALASLATILDGSEYYTKYPLNSVKHLSIDHRYPRQDSRSQQPGKEHLAKIRKGALSSIITFEMPVVDKHKEDFAKEVWNALEKGCPYIEKATFSKDIEVVFTKTVGITKNNSL